MFNADNYSFFGFDIIVQGGKVHICVLLCYLIFTLLGKVDLLLKLQHVEIIKTWTMGVKQENEVTTKLCSANKTDITWPIKTLLITDKYIHQVNGNIT